MLENARAFCFKPFRVFDLNILILAEDEERRRDLLNERERNFDEDRDDVDQDDAQNDPEKVCRKVDTISFAMREHLLRQIYLNIVLNKYLLILI